ncbi:MAG: multidrug ABC transporter ATP-binding protein [Anaerolineae bacterium]|jgi:ATP-binding cassette subfamily B protein|nr:MAG: multidrug ABC transporter ATP-binding protein [Anaerolineae bacterium]
MKHLIKLLPFLKPYWKKSLLSLLLLVVVVLLDLTIPRLVQRIIDQGILANDLSEVYRTFFLMLGISALDTLFAIGNNNTSVQVGESLARDLREALFVKMQSFSFGNLDRLQTGQWMVRLASDTSVVQRLVQITLRIGTRAPLIMLGSVILMYRTSRSLAILISPLMLVAIVLIVFFASRMGPLFLTLQQKLDRLNTVLQENIAGVRVVKAFVRAEHEAKRFAVTNEDYTERNIRVMQFLSTMGPSLSACLNAAIVVVIWGGGVQTVGGQVTPGQLVAFINYLQTAMGPLLIMVNLANVWAAAMASAERVNEILDQQPEVLDEPQAKPLPAEAQPRISFRGVRFRYNGSNDGMVLDGIDLDIEAGQTVAILGATGAGKTTLLHLIPRFYDVCEGSVRIDGYDVRELQQDSLLKQIAIVPQETILFSGTVRENIRYGRPQASDEEVVMAAKIAQAHDFILELPQGYDTHVEERGVNLSGGQKQRLAIARALLTRPSILLLDDSTSSVDVETEAKIQSGLRQWLKNRTCVMVAQRISTVLGADKIVVLEQGKIVAEGSHRELLQNSPVYQEIYASQLGDAQEVEIQHV